MTQQSQIRAEMLKYLRFIYRHLKELGGLLVVVGSVLAILTLYIYLHAIGRPDLFLESISIGPALFVWLLFCFLMAIACFAVMLIPSFYLNLAVLSFEAEDGLVRRISVRVFCVVVVGFFSICALLYSSLGFGPWYSPLIVYVVILGLCFFLFFLGESRDEYLKSIGVQYQGWKVLFARFLFVLWVSMLLMLCSAMGYFPAVFSFWAYRGSEDNLILFLGIAFFSMVASCAPFLLFMLNRDGGLKKYFFGLVGALGAIVVLCVMSPAIFDIITYKVAGLVGIRHDREVRYFVDKEYPVSEFDAGTWRVSGVSRDGFVISGFKLYGLGKNILFCPSKYLESDLKEWPKYSGFCVVLDSSKIISLPVKVESRDTGKAFLDSPLDKVGCVSAVKFTRPPLALSNEGICIFQGVR